MLIDAIFTLNRRKAYVLAEVEVKTIDDSFSHEFGICHVCHQEVGQVDVIECQYLDTDEAINHYCPIVKEEIIQALEDRLN